MDFKPAGKPGFPGTIAKQSRADGRAGPAPQGANPWAVVQEPLKQLESFGASRTGKRRRWAADTKGATPPRDGPFSPQAAAVYYLLPPKTRQRRRDGKR